MHNWNVVVTVRDRRLGTAKRLLSRFGYADRSGFFNVLVMRVDDGRAMLEKLQAEPKGDGGILSRVVPTPCTFDFASPEEFGTKAWSAIEGFVPELKGRSFHVRVHRRGSKGRLSSQNEERRLDQALLEALARAGTPGRVEFVDPDAIVVVEVVGPRAGASLWTREDLRRYPLLRLD